MSEGVINKAALQRLLDVIGGDREDLAELLEEFETSTPQTLAEMQAAAAAGDLGALRIASHSLKSNGRDFGADALATACDPLRVRMPSPSQPLSHGGGGDASDRRSATTDHGWLCVAT